MCVEVLISVTVHALIGKVLSRLLLKLGFQEAKQSVSAVIYHLLF